MNQESLQEEWRSEREPPVSRGLTAAAGTGHLRYELRQSFHYRYAGPVRNLEQRLVVVPPGQHGAQRRVSYRLSINGGDAEFAETKDEFGNTVMRVRIPHVAEVIEFAVEADVERLGADTVVLPGAALRDSRFLYQTRLTAADERLARAARDAAGSGRSQLDIAERLCHLVHESIAYEKGVTSVVTDASEAFALGKGVCQDHAHVMLAMCRVVGIPARYVSGHLLGEGSTHAWVEVLLPHPGQPGLAVALAFDPCHRRRADQTYVTVAVGRDYHDVAPASGSYIGRSTNELTSTTWLGMTEMPTAW